MPELDTEVTRPSPLVAVRRHWLLSAVLVVACTAAAVGFAFSRPTSYSAESRLAVDGSSLSAQAVAGFALASQELAANYARYVNNSSDQQALAAEIGADADSVESVSASPVPESNVVRVEVAASSPQIAVRATEAISDALLRQVNDSTVSAEATAAALTEYTNISNQVAGAEQAAAAAQSAVDAVVEDQAVGDLAALRATAATTAAQLAILQIQQEALGERYRNLVAENSGTASRLSIVQAAVPTGDDQVPRVQRLGLAGFAVGALLACAVAVLLERRRARRGTTEDSAAPTGPAGSQAATGPATPSAVPASVAPTSDAPEVAVRAESDSAGRTGPGTAVTGTNDGPLPDAEGSDEPAVIDGTEPDGDPTAQPDGQRSGAGASAASTRR